MEKSITELRSKLKLPETSAVHSSDKLSVNYSNRTIRIAMAYAVLIMTILALQLTFSAKNSYSNTESGSGLSQVADSTDSKKSTKADTFNVTITKPDSEEYLKPGEDYIVRWKNEGEKYLMNNAKLFLSTNLGLSWASVGIISLSEEKLNWKVPDTIQTNLAKLKIEVSTAKGENEEYESKGFTIGKSEYYKDRVSISTGVNFNYAAEKKFDGLYLGANFSVPNVFKVLYPVGIDLYFSQGKIVSNKKEVSKPDTSSRFSVNSDIQDQILYSAASIYLNFKHFQWIALHSEFNRTSRSYTSSKASSVSRRINDSTIVTRDTSFSSGENSQRKNEFLLAIPFTGVGFKFFDDKFYADVKALPLVLNFNSDNLLYYILRYRFGTNTSPKLSIGGNIKGPWGGNTSAIRYSGRNGFITSQIDEYDFPEIITSSIEVFVYASIDVELNKILDIFGLK